MGSNHTRFLLRQKPRLFRRGNRRRNLAEAEAPYSLLSSRQPYVSNSFRITVPAQRREVVALRRHLL
jgi:hypothetical protein